jgi:hypothetical protein
MPHDERGNPNLRAARDFLDSAETEARNSSADQRSRPEVLR